MIGEAFAGAESDLDRVMAMALASETRLGFSTHQPLLCRPPSMMMSDLVLKHSSPNASTQVFWPQRLPLKGVSGASNSAPRNRDPSQHYRVVSGDKLRKMVATL